MTSSHASSDPELTVDDPMGIIPRLLTWDIEHLYTSRLEALAEGMECLTYAEASKFVEAQAHAHLVIGAAWALESELDNADHHLQLAHDLFSSIDDEWGIISSILRMSLVWSHRRQIQFSLTKLPETIDRARRLDDPLLIAGLLNDLGIAQLDDGQIDEGIRSLSEANALAEQVGNVFHILVTKLNIADRMHRLFDYDTARDLCHECVELIERSPNRDLEYLFYECNYLLGKCESGFGQYRKAAEYFELAIAYAITQTNDHVHAELRFEVGLALYQAGNGPAAIEAFRDSLALWTHVDPSTYPPNQTIVKWWIESHTESWSWKTVDEMKQILAGQTAVLPEESIQLYDAISESAHRLGDLPMAIQYLRIANGLKVAYWQSTVVSRSHNAARSFRTTDVQRLVI